VITPSDFLNEHGLKYRLSGDELELNCILEECSSNPKATLYINKTTGKWCCHRCGSKGHNIKHLAYMAGLLEWKEPVKEGHLYIPPTEIDRWHTALFQNTDALEYLREMRGFSDTSIHQFRLGWKMDGDAPAITIPFFDNTNTCVGYKKYYYTSDKKPKVKFEKDSQQIFYNLNMVDQEQPLIITEGEFDAISLWQYGYRNVGSIPNGVNGLTDWPNSLIASKYMLCFDNDAAGQKGAMALGEVLGESKCHRVFPKLKDFNDYLAARLPKEEIEKCFTEAEPLYKISNTSAYDYLDLALHRLSDPEKQKGLSTGLVGLDAILGGDREGEITVITGETGNGKSAFTLFKAGEWLKNDKKVLIISGEMSGDEIVVRLASHHYNRKATEKDIKAFCELNKDRLFIPNIYNEWASKKDQLPIPKIFDIIDYYIDQGVQYFVIDHIHCFIRKGCKIIEDIEDFMTRCRFKVKTHPIHLFLVAQCRKKDKDKRRLTKDDLYGSSEIDHASWNIMVIHRENEKDHLVEVTIEKNRTWGNLGTCVLQFDVDSQTNYYDAKGKKK